jgi:Tfp pilus assembly protein PilN
VLAQEGRVTALNLASRPFRNERLPATLFAGAALLLGAFTIAHALALRDLLSDKSTTLHREVAALDDELARLRTRADALRGPAPDPNQIAQWALVKSLVDKRTFSWTELFSSLEEALPPGVRLQSVTPKLSRGRIEIDLKAIAQTTDDGLNLVETLEQRPEFVDVYPQKVPESSESGEFSYTMTYLPGAAVHRAAPAAAGDKAPKEKTGTDDTAPADEEGETGDDAAPTDGAADEAMQR